MITEISQRWFFTKNKIFIYDTYVRVQYSSLLKLNEISIPYETITPNKENYTTRIKHLKLFLRVTIYLTSIIFLLRNTTEYLSHVYLYFLATFIGIIVHHYITKQHVWKIMLENNTCIIINKEQPDEATVNDFIQKLFEQRDQYLKETYLCINENMPYEPQLRTLQWLRKIEVINGEEFDALRKKLDSLFKFEKRSIGF